MSTTIAAVYQDRVTAQHAVDELTRHGVPADRISVLSHQESGAGHPADQETNEASKGAKAGAVGGAVAGAATSLALAAVPGIGWVLAAGPIGSVLASSAVGLAVGATAGGITGALGDSGVDESDAGLYAEAIRRGGTVVTLLVAEKDEPFVRQLLEAHHPVDLERSAARWRESGWTGYDADAHPYDVDQAKAEREHFEREAAAMTVAPGGGPNPAASPAPNFTPGSSNLDRRPRVRNYPHDDHVDELPLGLRR